ncbi:MAG: hypothetical protein ABH816_00325 [Candidatus Levyibacteriota bacterium]
MPQTQKTNFEHLKEKWVSRHRELQNKLWTKHQDSLNWLTDRTKHLAVGSLGSLMLLTAPLLQSLPAPHFLPAKEQLAQNIDKNTFLISDLSKLVPNKVRLLTKEEEEEIANILSRDFNVKVAAQLNGKRLNRTYGIIGAEQHLARFPGDNMIVHFDMDEDARKYTSSGMAPGLGGWGYFVPFGEQLNEKYKAREKYYIAVQTFLAPGFDKNPKELLDFFKFRKMLIVNPNNGKAVVAVIGDAGPAEWTGKHLGGSPEVMSYLEREDGVKRGPVLYFFIDDPKDEVPLGPIENYNQKVS